MSTTFQKRFVANVQPFASKVLQVLSERNRKILAARHGIQNPGGKRRTLESIGRDYGITRERVRQIEEASYAKIRSSEAYELIIPAFEEIRSFLADSGGIVPEEYAIASLANRAQRPHLTLLFALNKDFTALKESDEYHASWGVSREAADTAREVLQAVIERIEKSDAPVSEDTLFEVLSTSGGSALAIRADNMRTFLSVSKKIQQGPFGKWGLNHWPEINPRGVRDKVYLVLDREAKPLHFRELAKLIDSAPFAKNVTRKKTHPQTVHNELIKDDRFVLIGRGIYALADWGYVSGTVKDVIMNILQQAGRPLEREELMTRVAEQRIVQRNTILLNLQNKHHFQKLEGNKYYLV